MRFDRQHRYRDRQNSAETHPLDPGMFKFGWLPVYFVLRSNAAEIRPLSCDDGCSDASFRGDNAGGSEIQWRGQHVCFLLQRRLTIALLSVFEAMGAYWQMQGRSVRPRSWTASLGLVGGGSSEALILCSFGMFGTEDIFCGLRGCSDIFMCLSPGVSIRPAVKGARGPAQPTALPTV